VGIILGTKKVEKKLGYVAELCPICRAPRAFEVKRIGVASHIYFISVGEGQLAGFSGRCQQCATQIPIDGPKFGKFEESPSTDIETLIQSTYPGFHGDYEERLEIEDRLKRGETVVLTNREKWLIEPFEMLSMDVEERFANARFDKESGIGCAATAMVFSFLCCGSSAVGEKDLLRDIMHLGMAAVAIVGLVYTVILIFSAPNRYIQREIVPRLARALRPVIPTKPEISECVARMKSKGHRIGKRINEEKLWMAIQQDPSLTQKMR
jgi:hypothetical protein